MDSRLEETKEDEVIETEYHLPGMGTLPEKIILTEESKRLFAEARDYEFPLSQGFAVIAWKGKAKESDEDVLYIDLVPAFNAEDGRQKANGDNVPYTIYDPDKKYTHEDYKNMAVLSPEILGRNTGAIHQFALEVLKKSGRIPPHIQKNMMLGLGIFKGSRNILLRQYRTNSANLNPTTVILPREMELANYYRAPGINIHDLTEDEIKEQNNEYKIKRSLPNSIRKCIRTALLDQLPIASGGERICEHQGGSIAAEEKWWKEYKDNPREKNIKMMDTLFTNIRVNAVPDNKLIEEILSYVKKNSEEIKEPSNFLDLQYAKGDTALMLAIQKGASGAVGQLLSAGASLRIENLAGDNALTIAIKNNRTDLVNLIIENGTDLNELISSSNQNLAMLAAQHGQTQLIKRLAEAKVDFNNPDEKNGKTPALIAAENGHADVITALAEAGASVNISDNTGSTPLNMAAKKGYTHVLKAFAEVKCDLNSLDAEGRTPLHEAVAQSQFATIKMLLESGVDPDIQDNSGKLPLADKSDNVIELLYEKFADGSLDIMTLINLGGYLNPPTGIDINVPNRNGNTLAYLAIKKDDLQALEVLIGIKADLNKPNNDGFTPAMLAAQEGHTRAIEILAEAKVNLDEQDEQGKTPAILGAYNGHAEVIKALFESKADLNKIDNQGRTALHHAIKQSQLEAVQMLLECKAKTNIQDRGRLLPNAGKIPIVYASDDFIELLYKEFAENNLDIHVLIHLGMDLNKPDKMGNTLVYLAASKDDAKAMQVLIEAKADLNRPNQQGQTALHQAIIQSQFTAIIMLLKLGANTNIRDKSQKLPIDYASSRVEPFVILQMLKLYIEIHFKREERPELAVRQLDRIKNAEKEEKTNWTKVLEEVVEITNQPSDSKAALFFSLKTADQNYVQWFTSPDVLKEEVSKALAGEKISFQPSRT